MVYESTVYPGCTEEVCVPILERESGLKFNRDFFAGYSPERINPGDKEHRLTTIRKVTSGSTPEVADFVDRLYGAIVTAGTHRASSIRVAEAAKVIENTQRDVNIALINELALIFNRLGIDTEEVLNAAGSKWNFLPFRPGLVGGHCIGVDPYYLTHKAQEIGYHPEMILAGRRLNDNMALYVAGQITQPHGAQAHPRERRARPGARHHLQGKLPRHPQLQGGGRGARAAEARRARSTSTIPGPTAPSAAHEYGLTPLRTLARAALRRGGSGGGAPAIPRAGRRAACAACARRTTCVYDIKHVFPAAAGRRAPMKILVTGAAGFIGFHTDRSSCWRAATRSSASTTSTTTTTSP